MAAKRTCVDTICTTDVVLRGRYCSEMEQSYFQTSRSLCEESYSWKDAKHNGQRYQADYTQL